MKVKYVINDNSKKRNSKFNLAIQIIKLIFVRAILVTICGLLTSFYICITNLKYIYLLFILPMATIVIETIYISTRRRGRDFSWFSLSALAYITVLISIIWKQARFKNKIGNLECKNEDANLEEKELLKLCFKFELSTCELIQVISCVFLVPIIFLRWMSPYSKKLSFTAHSTLIITLLASAADLVDFIEYINFERIIDALHGVDAIMALTTLSSLVFCFNLTQTKELKFVERNTLRFWINFLVCTEAWSIILQAFILDIPYLIMRSIIISKVGLFVQSTLAFFFLKNILMILGDAYRIVGLWKEFNNSLKLLEKNEEKINNSYKNDIVIAKTSL